MFDGAQIAGFEGAHVDDHVDLAGAVEHGAARFVPLDVGSGGAERESDHGTDANTAPRERPGAQRDPHRVDADGRETELRGLAAQLFDLLTRGIGLQQGVIDHRRHTCRGATGGVHADARGTRLEHALQAIRATVVDDRMA